MDVLKECAEVSEECFEGEWTSVCAIAWQAHEEAQLRRWFDDEDAHDASEFLLRCLAAQYLYTRCIQVPSILTPTVASLLVAAHPPTLEDALILADAIDNVGFPRPPELEEQLRLLQEDTEPEVCLSFEERLAIAKEKVLSAENLNVAETIIGSFPALYKDSVVANAMFEQHAIAGHRKEAIDWSKWAELPTEKVWALLLQASRDWTWDHVSQYKRKLEKANALDEPLREILFQICAREGRLRDALALGSLQSRDPQKQLQLLQTSLERDEKPTKVINTLRSMVDNTGVTTEHRRALRSLLYRLNVPNSLHNLEGTAKIHDAPKCLPKEQT